MKPVAVAFSGAIGSGKSSLALAVGEKTDWPVVGFGDYVRSVAQSEGKDAGSRAVLQEIGERLLAADCNDFCTKVLAQKMWVSGTSVLIEGIRHMQVLEVLRKIVAPIRLVHIHVSVPAEVQAQRLQSRDPGKETDMASIQSHSTEVQVKSVLPSVADLVLSGDQPLAELAEKIIAHLATL